MLLAFLYCCPREVEVWLMAPTGSLRRSELSGAASPPMC